MIIERYLFREVSQSFAGVFTVLLLILLSNRFVRTLGEAAKGDISSNAVMQLIGLKLVDSLALIMPLAFFLAVLLAMGRLYRDSEVTAMHAGGIGTGRFLRSILGFSLLFAFLVGFISLYAAPRAADIAEELEFEAEQGSDMAGIFPGRFKEFSDGDRVFYAREISDDYLTMSDVFVQIRGKNKLTLVAAPEGHQYLDEATGDRFIVFSNGYRYSGLPGQADYVVTRFERQAVRIQDSQIGVRKIPTEALPTTELFNATDRKASAELQWRFSMPVSLVILGMLGVLLSRASPRQGRYGRLFNAILLYVLYSNLLGIARELTEDGEIPQYIGIWPVHGVMLMIFALMFFYQSRIRWWLAVAWARRKKTVEDS